jgi:hypothetical protein
LAKPVGHRPAGWAKISHESNPVGHQPAGRVEIFVRNPTLRPGYIKHTKTERDETKRKFSNRFSNRIRQYISESEGTNSSSQSEESSDYDTDLIDEMKALIIDLSSCSSSSLLLPSNKSSSVKTFFFFENPEIMINNLINRFLIHSLILFQMTSFQIDMKTDIDQNCQGRQ